MVVALRSWELLGQARIVFQWRKVQRRELSAGERRTLPDVLKKLLPTWCCQQGRGRSRPRQPFGWFGGRCFGSVGRKRRPFVPEQRQHGGILVMGWAGEPFGLFG